MTSGMNSKYVPSDNAILTCGGGKIAFGLSGRAWDELGHRLVVVELTQQSLLYGEWAPRYRANGDDFDIDILAFGYRDGFLAGSPEPSDRLEFSAEKCQVIESLIHRLFVSPITATEVPFSLPRARFLGGVHFLDGWIRQS